MKNDFPDLFIFKCRLLLLCNYHSPDDFEQTHNGGPWARKVWWQEKFDDPWPIKLALITASLRPVLTQTGPSIRGVNQVAERHTGTQGRWFSAVRGDQDPSITESQRSVLTEEIGSVALLLQCYKYLLHWTSWVQQSNPPWSTRWFIKRQRHWESK